MKLNAGPSLTDRQTDRLPVEREYNLPERAICGLRARTSFVST